MRGLSSLLAAGSLLATAAPAAAQKPVFRLNQGSPPGAQGALIEVNRVGHGLGSGGLIGATAVCCDFYYGSTWPRGTSDNYLFLSGYQVSGIVGGQKSPSNPWGGDTTGGFFFDARGTQEHGIGLTSVFASVDKLDAADWPTEARVPAGDAGALNFAPSLQGRVTASEGDFWYLGWEGDPGVNSGRPHPLGIAVETRAMAWNYPVGNEDIVYFVVTFYNVSSARAADYAAYRPGLRDRLASAGAKFQQLNNAKFGITLPVGGYTIDSLFVAYAADADVASAGTNFSSAAIPFAMGFTWDARFSSPTGWTFDPTIFGKPFFTGAGFYGTPFLSAPNVTSAIRLYSNTTNGGAFPDPPNIARLFKALSGAVASEANTGCNVENALQTHICYVAQVTPYDARYVQSTGPASLAPGASVTFVLANVFAAPVRLPGVTAGGNIVFPGDPARMSNASLLASSGANQIDSIAGFAGYTDANGDGVVQPGEVQTVRRSLYAKAQLAQAIFDAKFLLPTAPDAPEFFLIPGDNRVTVVWKPSATEATGDPYYEFARSAVTTPAGGGAPVANPLYDPNFRKFDVQGYRVFRGRTADPATMTLVAEYHYANTTFDDYDGRVPVGLACAPELGITTTCAGLFDAQIPGVARTRKQTYAIDSKLVQVKEGERIVLDGGSVVALKADTAGRGLSPGSASFSGTGVPFAFTDTDVRNTSSYYYAVTAFDYNSIQSGPASLESARVPKRAVPLVSATNYATGVTVESGVYGRRGLPTDNVAPTLDPVTGRFSKKALPANGLTLTLDALVTELLRGSGEVSIRLDSILTGAQSDGNQQNATYHYSVTTASGTSKLAVPLATSLGTTVRTSDGNFLGVPADPTLTARYGGSNGFAINATWRVMIPSGYYTTLKSRGCINNAGGFPGAICQYNGPRWFVGDNETKDNPNSANTGAFSTNIVTTDFNNVGATPPGVGVIHEPKSYNDRLGGAWRQVEGALAPFAGAADYRLYWGSNWVIDSVIDLTHDVPVPFSTSAGATWGVLNAAAVPAAQSFD
ncbi:MAG: hypothetical protein V4503_04540, partial [Gemmatimonadota bacterium]